MSKIADMTTGRLLAELLNGYDSAHGLCGCEDCLKRAADAVDAAIGVALMEARSAALEEAARLVESLCPACADSRCEYRCSAAVIRAAAKGGG